MRKSTKSNGILYISRQCLKTCENKCTSSGMVFKFSLVHRFRSKLSLRVLRFTLATRCCFQVGRVEATTLGATTKRHILRLSFVWMDTGRQIGFRYRPKQINVTELQSRDRQTDRQAFRQWGHGDAQRGSSSLHGKVDRKRWCSSMNSISWGGEGSDIITLSQMSISNWESSTGIQTQRQKAETGIATDNTTFTLTWIMKTWQISGWNIKRDRTIRSSRWARVVYIQMINLTFHND